jgi:hypothetical protein
MTLHEAIEKLLRKVGRPMTTQQIADELNNNGWYQKKDGSEISAFQIHGRTKNYDHMFKRNGSTVSLIGQTSASGLKEQLVNQAEPEQRTKILNPVSLDISMLLKLKQNQFNPVEDSITRIPEAPGNYIFCLKPNCRLPYIEPIMQDFYKFPVIYTGVASKSLRSRD